MTKVWIVAGDNGKGNDGHVVLGIYPTEELAEDRRCFAEVQGLADWVYYKAVEVGPEGGDFEFEIGG
jgi:hypothetical protein